MYGVIAAFDGRNILYENFIQQHEYSYIQQPQTLRVLIYKSLARKNCKTTLTFCIEKRITFIDFYTFCLTSWVYSLCIKYLNFSTCVNTITRHIKNFLGVSYTVDRYWGTLCLHSTNCISRFFCKRVVSETHVKEKSVSCLV